MIQLSYKSLLLGETFSLGKESFLPRLEFSSIQMVSDFLVHIVTSTELKCACRI